MEGLHRDLQGDLVGLLPRQKGESAADLLLSKLVLRDLTGVSQASVAAHQLLAGLQQEHAVLYPSPRYVNPLQAPLLQPNCGVR